MNAHLKLTKAGANLIQHFEGCLKKAGGHYVPYKCPANVLTIGWGHTNHHGRKFDAATRWTADECHAAFLEDMEGFERDGCLSLTISLMRWCRSHTTAEREILASQLSSNASMLVTMQEPPRNSTNGTKAAEKSSPD